MENRKMTYKSAPRDARFENSLCGMRLNGGGQQASGAGEGDVTGTPYLTFEAFDRIPFLKHGFSTRYGGVSGGCLSSMNLGFGRGDTRENLVENYRRMGAAIGFRTEDAVISDQTHTTNLRVVTAEDRGKGLFRPKDYSDVDGLLTAEPGIPLVTLYADCVPLFFADTTHRAVALSHSGWKGTVNHMAEVTMERMRREFGTGPEDLTVAIGPSICQDCYEVTGNVIEAFRDSFPREIWKDLFYRKDEEHWQLNLWYASYWQFRNAGLAPAQISLPGVCTCCNPDVLFSHRASGGKRGNLGAFLMLCE
ncbi:MAG: peptidoglycan editing factor PgeF [Lachnospiraceae bacterium]|nr:peptidoglycan editing factor PgeF [Lachnospiraceae bacterium]